MARAYRVRAHGHLDAAAMAQTGALALSSMRSRYRPIKVTVDRRQGGNSWLNMVLSEGKNREIKRLLEHFGLRVTRLIRTGYGPFQPSPISLPATPKKSLATHSREPCLIFVAFLVSGTSGL